MPTLTLLSTSSRGEARVATNSAPTRREDNFSADYRHPTSTTRLEISLREPGFRCQDTWINAHSNIQGLYESLDQRHGDGLPPAFRRMNSTGWALTVYGPGLPLREYVLAWPVWASFLSPSERRRKGVLEVSLRSGFGGAPVFGSSCCPVISLPPSSPFT